MDQKICPLLTMGSRDKDGNTYEEECMGDRCAWFEKCFPVPTLVYNEPRHVVIDNMPCPSYPNNQNWQGYPWHGYFDSNGNWIYNADTNAGRAT